MTIIELGNNIKRLREFKGITPSQLQRDIGVQQHQLKAIENGGRCNTTTLFVVLDYLGIELTHRIK